MPELDPSDDLDRINSVAAEDEEISDDSSPVIALPVARPWWKRFPLWIASICGRLCAWDDEEEVMPRPGMDASEAAHRSWSAKNEHLARVSYLQLQKRFAGRLYRLVRLWLALVIAAVFLTGFGGLGPWPFKLSDNVLIAFITSTTASVLGLFVLVARWLFESKVKKEPVARKTRTKKTEEV